MRVAPLRGEVNEIVRIAVGIDEASQSVEWQVLPVDRMSDEQRITGRQLNGPEIDELDQEAVLIEEWRSDHLIVVVEVDGCALKAGQWTHRHVPIPKERAILDPNVGRQR